MDSRKQSSKTNRSRAGNGAEPQFRRHVSGRRTAGSMRQRSGVDFSRRRERRVGSTSVTQGRNDAGMRERRAEATSRRTKTASAVSKNRSRRYLARTAAGRGGSASVRQASQSQRRGSASDAARRRNLYYIRKRRRTQQLRIRYAVMASLLIMIIFLIFQIFPVISSAQVEVGTVVNATDFLRFGFMGGSFPGGKADYDMHTPGTYDVLVRSGLFNHTVKLTVVDTEAPKVEVKDVEIGMGDSCEPKDFVVSIEDGSETKITYGNEPNLDLIGETQEVKILVTDAGNNVTEKTAHLTVLPIATQLRVEIGTGTPTITSFMGDVTEPDDENYLITDLASIDFMKPAEFDVKYRWRGKDYSCKVTVEDTTDPVFDLAEDFTAFLGEAIRYKQHVDVYDNSGVVDLEIDTSKVEQDKLGTYDIYYTAKDPYGHTSTATAKITIAEKTADEAQLFEKVDAILADIIRDDMSAKEKATAIFKYTNTSFLFVNDSDKSDYVKAALTMLDIRQGDCYSFFALAKALLTRAGIKNVDIYTLDGTNEHYWNLVDIDDGHGWYHFDATPTLSGAEILFYQEADLKPLNDGRYDYDHSKFPKVS